MRRRGYSLAAGAMLAALVGATIAIPAQAAKKATPKTYPSLALENMQGKKEAIPLKAKGKTNLVVYWATWCIPCREEVPALNQLQKKYKAKGFSVRGVSADQNGWKVIKPFLKTVKMNYPVYLASDKALNAFGEIDALPAMFLIDSQGRVAKRYVGAQDMKKVEKDVQKAISAK
jgi:cytochrome c biogenesis protein CcmG/thiol:disulfide interchange protein DsbE